MTLTEKIRSMTAKEIIMAMVKGLRARHTVIRMNTFGCKVEGICYGCAATNTIVEIAGDMGYLEFMDDCFSLRRFDYDRMVHPFESAIDSLRSGGLGTYNDIARRERFAIIKDIGEPLPALRDRYTEHELLQYVLLANEQDQ